MTCPSCQSQKTSGIIIRVIMNYTCGTCGQRFTKILPPEPVRLLTVKPSDWKVG